MLALVLIAAAFLILAALLGYAVGPPGSQWLGSTLVRGNPADEAVALTFDDGPGEATPRILGTLKKHGVRATFFLCGQNVERFPELARRIAEEGHEIGNHTYSHPLLLWKSPGRIAWEIDRAQKVIAFATGRSPALFRPPYGIRWFGLFPILAARGMQTVMWSASGKDWRLPAERIRESVLAETKAGSVILLHDGVPPREKGNHLQTAEALERILPPLLEQYRFIPVSEMLAESSGLSRKLVV